MRANVANKEQNIYEKMVNERILFLVGDTNQERCSNLVAQLLYLDSISHEDITLYIDSQGGSCTAGLSVMDTMNIIKSDVCTIVTGMAASMGSIIASSGTKGKRFIYPHSEFMIHQVSSGTSGQVSDMRISLENAERTYGKLLKILQKNTGKTIKQLRKDCDRDTWLDAEQSIKYGLCDKVLG